jgi:hypothetical protein
VVHKWMRVLHLLLDNNTVASPTRSPTRAFSLRSCKARERGALTRECQPAALEGSSWTFEGLEAMDRVAPHRADY